MSRIAEAMMGAHYGDLFDRPLAPRNPKLMPEEVPIEVCVLFEQLALRVAKAEHKRFSSDAILHRVRWEHTVEKGDREFKCNNNWTAPLARWFMANHPEYGDFFEIRKRKSIENDDL